MHLIRLRSIYNFNSQSQKVGIYHESCAWNAQGQIINLGKLKLSPYELVRVKHTHSHYFTSTNY